MKDNVQMHDGKCRIQCFWDETTGQHFVCAPFILLLLLLPSLLSLYSVLLLFLTLKVHSLTTSPLWNNQPDVRCTATVASFKTLRPSGSLRSVVVMCQTLEFDFLFFLHLSHPEDRTKQIEAISTESLLLFFFFLVL